MAKILKKQNYLKNSSEFGPNSHISEKFLRFFENVFLSKFLGKNPQNFVQLAAPKICQNFFKDFLEKLFGSKFSDFFGQEIYQNSDFS